MVCEKCKDTVEIVTEQIPHVIRKCKTCGREMKIREAGDHGIGIRVEKGDRFIIPEGWFRIHANPLKGRGQLTKAGLEWFAKLIFLDKFPREQDQVKAVLDKNDTYCTNILQKSDLLAGLDIENEKDSKKIFDILKENQDTAEWFAYTFGTLNSIAMEALDQGDIMRTAWAVAGAERFRSMLVFKQELEDVVWMGHSARRLINLLETWDSNNLRTGFVEDVQTIQFMNYLDIWYYAYCVPDS